MDIPKCFTRWCPSFTQPGGECGTVLCDMIPPIIERAHESCMSYEHPIPAVISSRLITIVGEMDFPRRDSPWFDVLGI
jgi:hypothetical protein